MTATGATGATGAWRPRPAPRPRRAWTAARFADRWVADRLPTAVVLARRDRAADRFVAHARRHVPFWADRLPGASTLADVEPVTKTELLGVPVEARRAGARNAHVSDVSSSGTTGDRIAIEFDARTAWLASVAAMYRTYRRGGRVGAPTLTVSAQFAQLAADRGRADNSGAAVSPKSTPAEIAELIARRRPEVVSGAPHLLAAVAPLVAGRVRPKLVVTGAEMSSPELDAAIEAGFGTRPLDTYGSVETALSAWQCRERDLYHIEHGTILVEVLDLERGVAVEPGGTGDLVVTTFANPFMPLVRYVTGDRATLADRPCRCGVSHPALASIDGRVLDWMVAADGRPIAPTRLWPSERGLLDAGIRTYRYTQAADRSMTVEVVVAPDRYARAVALIGDRLRAMLGDVPVTFHRCDALPLVPGEKYRQFRSAAVPTLDR